MGSQVEDEGEELDEKVRESETHRWRGKLLAEGYERQVGILMSASCFKWNREHKSVCSETDVTAAKHSCTL